MTPSAPRICLVASAIAACQQSRERLTKQIEAHDRRGEQLETSLEVVDSEQTTLEREMDTLTRSQVVRK